jgi:hypothetical protein
MIWRRTATDHLAAIGSFARMWLAWGILDRLIPVTLLGWLWCCVWFWIGLATQDVSVMLLIMLFVWPVPWVLLGIDAFIDKNQVNSDIAAFANEGAILATRCEYLGGHPQLPHGRFAYLLLEGTRQNPTLALVFPGAISGPTTARMAIDKTSSASERYLLPVLDVGKMKNEKGSDDSPAADIATSINKGVGQFLRSERLNFVVNYDGAGGRQHKVEFGNFFRGNNEIRNWQNYIVCAQAQADTGVEPHSPWVNLPDEPTPTSDILHTTKKLEMGNGVSGNGHEERKSSSAFSRR